jgi:hypothetical protein
MWKAIASNFIQQNSRKVATAASIAGVGVLLTTQAIASGQQSSQADARCGCVSSCCGAASPVQEYIPVADPSLSGSCGVDRGAYGFAASGAPATYNISYSGGSTGSRINIAVDRDSQPLSTAITGGSAPASINITLGSSDPGVSTSRSAAATRERHHRLSGGDPGSAITSAAAIGSVNISLRVQPSEHVTVALASEPSVNNVTVARPASRPPTTSRGPASEPSVNNVTVARQ